MFGEGGFVNRSEVSPNPESMGSNTEASSVFHHVSPKMTADFSSPPRYLASYFLRSQVQKRLSDEDKRLVQTSMLVGIAPELIGNTADEIMAISRGKDHFIVQGVLRSGDSFFVQRTH